MKGETKGSQPHPPGGYPERPRFTPYADRGHPFGINLRSLDPSAWIDVDDRLAIDLARKSELFDDRFEAVFQALPGTEDAQREVLEALADHLGSCHGKTHSRDGDTVTVRETGASQAIGNPDVPPLLAASRLVQDDLCLMRKGEAGYRLVAASLCFPSGWRLHDKIGRPMVEIHAPVPGYAGRMASMVDRIFEKLRVGLPVWRMNWSIYSDDDLHMPGAHDQVDWAPGLDITGDNAFIRTERQTLTRMPRSGDILFTIKVAVDPLHALPGSTRGRDLARALGDGVDGLNDAELGYKGLLQHKTGIRKLLSELSSDA
ncbi:MAG: DUF3445 domain-containing protein [Pseudomonadota bacterium]